MHGSDPLAHASLVHAHYRIQQNNTSPCCPHSTEMEDIHMLFAGASSEFDGGSALN